MKLSKSELIEMILEVMNEAFPTKEPEGPKQASTNIMDNPFDTSEKEDDEDDEDKKEESITSKLKREFKEYESYNKHVRKL